MKVIFAIRNDILVGCYGGTRKYNYIGNAGFIMIIIEAE